MEGHGFSRADAGSLPFPATLVAELRKAIQSLRAVRCTPACGSEEGAWGWLVVARLKPCPSGW